jgi:hypothetical protein
VNTFDLVNTTILNKSKEIYLKSLNEAMAKVVTGTMTKQQALSEIAGKWATKGIPAMTDSLGREWSTEAYVNMVMRSTLGNTANSMQMAGMDEYDVDLVEVTTHQASRPSHVKFQGNLYSRSGKSKRYPHLDETGYGTLTGIGGINCSHRLMPFVQGKSIRRKQVIDEKENNKAYKESQIQRKLEVDVRKAKKKLIMAEEIGNEDFIREVKLEIKAAQGNVRDYVAETGRTRRYNRERIVTP